MVLALEVVQCPLQTGMSNYLGNINYPQLLSDGNLLV